MSLAEASKKQTHIDRKKHAKTDTFEMEEQANGNNVVTFFGHSVGNEIEEKQVSIYQ